MRRQNKSSQTLGASILTVMAPQVRLRQLPVRILMKDGMRRKPPLRQAITESDKIERRLLGSAPREDSMPGASTENAWAIFCFQCSAPCVAQPGCCGRNLVRVPSPLDSARPGPPTQGLLEPVLWPRNSARCPAGSGSHGRTPFLAAAAARRRGARTVARSSGARNRARCHAPQFAGCAGGRTSGSDYCCCKDCHGLAPVLAAPAVPAWVARRGAGQQQRKAPGNAVASAKRRSSARCFGGDVCADILKYRAPPAALSATTCTHRARAQPPVQGPVSGRTRLGSTSRPALSARHSRCCAAHSGNAAFY